MSHHGSVPPEFLSRLRDLKDQIGPTGEFPAGRLSPEDEGGLRYAVVRHGSKIMLRFGKPIEWIGFGENEAMALAQALIKEIGNIKGVPMVLRVGRGDER